MELTDASPEECHKRNIHNRSLADIQQAAAQWQGTPPVYPLLDLGPLFGFNRKKSKQVTCECMCICNACTADKFHACTADKIHALLLHVMPRFAYACACANVNTALSESAARARHLWIMLTLV